MDIRTKIKNVLSNYNPLAIIPRNRMQRKLVNCDFSFICPNCLGGMLKVRGLVVFTAHDYCDIPYTRFIPKYQSQGTVGNIRARSDLNEKKSMNLILIL